MTRTAGWFGVLGVLAAAGLALAGALTARQSLTLGMIVIVLAVTNFGRSCPLIMSIRWWIGRMRQKRKQAGESSAA